MITKMKDSDAVLECRRRVPTSLFVIGCSTGGPAALRRIIPLLPAKLPVPVVVVQHMPPGFVGPLAKELDRRSSVRVRVAGDRCRIGRGEVWFAPSERHLGVRYQARGVLETVLQDGPPVHGCRPAVDPLAASAAKVVGRTATLVILTGMGNDGLAGAARIRQHGGLVIAQDSASSQVFGMPRAVIEDDLADVVLSPEMIASFMTKSARKNLDDDL